MERGALPEAVVHTSFSPGDLKTIYSTIPYDFPGRGPDPETQPYGRISIIPRPPVVRVDAALAEESSIDVLVLENDDCKISNMLQEDFELNYLMDSGVANGDIVPRLRITSVRDIYSALAFMEGNKYKVATSELELGDMQDAGIKLSKLMDYRKTPLILYEHEGDIFAVLGKSKYGNCHVFPFSEGNYTRAIKHFIGVKPDPSTFLYIPDETNQ